MYQPDDPRHLTAKSTRVHYQSAAHSSGNAFAELKPGQAFLYYLLHQRTKFYRSTRRNLITLNRDRSETRTECHDQAANTTVTHQQVRSSTQTENRNTMLISCRYCRR